MASMAKRTEKGPISFTKLIVIVVIAMGLSPVIIVTTGNAAASLTGASQMLVNLIPLFYFFAIAFIAILFATRGLRLEV